MTEASTFSEHIVDLLRPFGAVTAKRMFGSVGIFHQDLMIGLIADGSLYLKAEPQSRHLFEAENLAAFTYLKKDKPFQLSYYLAPEAFYEDEDETKRWAQLAFDAALRAPKKNKKTRKTAK